VTSKILWNNGMELLLYCVKLYFASMLIISGLSKISSLEGFRKILYKQAILPSWSITTISNFFPWVEVVLALLLIATDTILAIFVAGFVLILFVVFVLFETVLIITKRASLCGCYGLVYAQKVEIASLGTSLILLIRSQ
jgi:Methylamine utilisation protein MauE